MSVFHAQGGIPISWQHPAMGIAQTRQGAPSHVLETTCCSPAHFSLDLAKHLSAGLNSSQSLAEISSFVESRSKQAKLLAVTREVNSPSYLRERCSNVPGVGSSYQEAIVPLGSKHPHIASHQHETRTHVHGKITPSWAVFPHFRLHQARIHLPPWKLIAIIKQKELAKRSLR